MDHTLHNEDERLRLRHLGHNGDQLGGHNFTRCFGNYLVKVCSTVLFIQIRHDAYGDETDENVFKGGHKEVPALAACRDDPVIPEPEVPILILVEQSRPFRVIHAPYTP